MRDRKRIAVYSGGRQDWIGGPAVKINRLAEYFPSERYAFNLIYSVGATIPPDVCRWAQARGVKVVCHINSMKHAAYAADYAERNHPAREIHALADRIVYGSEHARNAAKKYLGAVDAPNTVIYNAVDTDVFQPPPTRSDGRLVILAAGVHSFRHRLEPLLRAMPSVLAHLPKAELLVAGPLVAGQGIFDCGPDSIARLAAELNLRNARFLGEYSQEQAPGIYAQADVLVHLKHMDWTPNTVIEAMSCGLAIVHAGNGGLTELVGDAGISLGVPDDWDNIRTPDPENLGKAIMEAYQRRHPLGEAARQRAVERYNMTSWIARHRSVFEEILGR